MFVEQRTLHEFWLSFRGGIDLGEQGDLALLQLALTGQPPQIIRWTNGDSCGYMIMTPHRCSALALTTSITTTVGCQTSATSSSPSSSRVGRTILYKTPPIGHMPHTLSTAGTRTWEHDGRPSHLRHIRQHQGGIQYHIEEEARAGTRVVARLL